MGEDKTTGAQRFVATVLSRCRDDRGFAAKLRRADNPDTEDQSWGVLTGLGVDINRETDSLPHALVGAALSRLKSNADGDLDLGQALHDCFEKGDQGEARLRRVLACDSLGEVVTVLRPILRLIGAQDVPLAYADLLDDLLHFPIRWERMRRRWASRFYARDSEPDQETAQETTSASAGED